MAGGRLAVGSEPIVLSSTGPYFPIVERFGDCAVTVTVSNPHEPPPPPWEAHVDVTPDKLRQMASWLNTICVNPFGLGGFVTVSIQNMIGFIANQTTTDMELRNGPWPAEAAYFTVTLTGTDKQPLQPVYNDPMIAEALSDGVRAHGNSRRADMLSLSSTEMSRGGDVSWGFAFDQNTDEKSEMSYTCDSKLGAPSSTDCSQLAYSGLGAPSDTVTVGPGSTKFLNFKSCNAAITAKTTISLTWAQISAGLNALINTCVTHPYMGSRGGRASAIPHVHGKRKRRVKKRDITGNNAFPPGMALTLFKQNGALPNAAAEMATCTWKKILSGGDVATCSSS